MPPATTNSHAPVTGRSGAAAAPAPGSGGAPVALPVAPPPKLRRRPLLIALGVALVALGAVAAAWVAATVGDTHAVLALRGGIARGEVIAGEDLTVARVSADPALRTVPAGDIDGVVGRRAALDLPAGALLTPGAATDTTSPPPGQALVGVTLTPAQLPAQPLRPGDTVRIVSTPRPQDDPPAAAPAALTAVVVSTVGLPESGQVVVDVTVVDDQADRLAALAATGRVAVVLQPPSGAGS